MNTRYFHAMASSKKRRNNIKRFVANNGNIVSDAKGLCEVRRYFDNIFQHIEGIYSSLTDTIERRITSEHN